MAASHLPAGFRFHPTDEELLVHYLKRKALGIFVDDWVIGEVEMYKHEPMELPGMAVLRSRDSEWFFFNPQDKRQLHGSRPNRTTKGGYWKATGKDRRIAVGSCVGMKKTLIYYSGRAPHGERTDWIMHEYRLDDGAKAKKKLNSNDSFVLCRVRRKSGLGPRNGEQYGAPVLEEEEEEVCNLANDAGLSSSMSAKPMMAKRSQVVPPIVTVLADPRRTDEDLDVFLQSFLSFEDLQGDHNPKEDLMVDELLSLLNDQSDGPLVPTGTTNLVDVESCNGSDALHGDNNRFTMPEDMPHFVASQLDMASQQFSGSQVPCRSSYGGHLQGVGFLELADLEEPCHSPSSLGSADLQNLLLELDAGMEFSISSGLAQDELQLQQNLQPFGHIEDIRGSLRVGGSGMNNESEVPLGSPQGLSVLENLRTRLLTLDDKDVLSGLASCSGQERGLALSHSQGMRAQEQPETGHVDVDKCTVSGNRLLGSVPRIKLGVDHVQKEKSANSEAGSLADDYNRVLCPMPCRPTPSKIARLISLLLGKMNALPASAEELHMEWERQLVNKQSSLSYVNESKARQLALMDPAPSSICGSSLTLKVEMSSPLQHEKQLSVRPPQWSVSSIAIMDGHCRSFVKGFTSVASMFLFCTTTLALFFFCMFRGFCRSTRVAFT